MENYRNTNSDFQMTKEEYKQIKEAFEKEEFRKMFSDYLDEINDPKNKAIYEQEITQLEKERGVDVTFIHPNPGFVIKTSVDGNQKAFINVCHNDKIGKPVSKPEKQGNSQGLQWSLPYIQAPPRIDLDKSKHRCVVYDVVFHPDTLYLAKKNADFKQFVIDTSVSAVERSFKVSLDRRNIKFPKLCFKGPKEATVIRRKIENSSSSGSVEGPMNIPNYPYAPLKENPVTEIVTPGRTICEDVKYTSPKYIIKYRKGIDMQEYTEEIDSKMYAATPTELLIIIDLPLVKSASDVKLDVFEKSLSLVSENPAKYLLNLTLPVKVDESGGSAKFDRSTKKLHVVLPVMRRKYALEDFVRDDSGIESDPSHSVKSSSEEDICSSIQELCEEIKSDFTINENLSEISNENNTDFLDSGLHYSFPSYVINTLNEAVCIVLHVKNVDQTSIKHKLTDENDGLLLVFTTVGSGFFPVNYSFCMKIPNIIIDSLSLNSEVGDNVIIKFKVHTNNIPLTEYYVGVNPTSLSKQYFSEPSVIADSIIEKMSMINCHREEVIMTKLNNKITENFLKFHSTQSDDKLNNDSVIDSKDLTKDINLDNCLIEFCTSKEETDNKSAQVVDTAELNKTFNLAVSVPKDPISEVKRNQGYKGNQNKKMGDEENVELVNCVNGNNEIKFYQDKLEYEKKTEVSDSLKSVEPSPDCKIELAKKVLLMQRRVSESEKPTQQEPLRRSILKCSRSLSESNVDDYGIWSSLDSSDSCIPEEMTKKTVRFSDVICKQVYRTNSSILGQRKKNQRKARNKKRAQERRASESEEVSGSEMEVSDAYDSVSDLSSDMSDVSSDTSEVEDVPKHEVIPSSKTHRRRGHKNKRKNASTAKHNTVFSNIDD